MLTKSLRWQITFVFVALSLILVMGYSSLSADFFVQGMDNMMSAKMEEAAIDYRKQPSRDLPTRHYGYEIHDRLETLPMPLREPNGDQIEPENLYVQRLEGERGLWFLLRYDDEQGSIYVVNQISRETVSRMTRRNGDRNRLQLAFISLGSALLLAIIIWWFVRRVFYPVAKLRSWTGELTPENLQEPRPGFSYTELNELADIIRNSMLTVNESLERERKFLRHTSHELRTPIATIQNNLELLKKLKSLNDDNAEEKTAQAMARIERASATMKILSETLLWLHRQDTESLPTKDIELDQLVQQLIAEAQHLINHKGVKLTTALESTTVNASEAALSIVLGNLIRNAFQHTFEGHVEIIQQGGEVLIVNEDTGAEESDLGFGLGLQLTEALCQRLGWAYRNERTENGHRARVSIPSS